MSVKASGGGGSGWKQRETTPVLIIAATVLLLLLLGAGGFYLYNGGWKTASQQDEDYKHNLQPIMAAKHGDRGPLEAENRLRKEHGEAPLEMPNDHHQQPGNSHDKLMDLQRQLTAHQGKQPGS